MSDEPAYLALERRTPETAEATMFTVGATTGAPKAVIRRHLRRYLADMQDQAYTNALRGKPLEERDQQN